MRSTSSCHHKAKLLFVSLAALYGADYPAFEYNVYPVRKAHNLIKLKAHQQHGLVLVALIHYVLVYILNRTNVKPARGVNGYKKILVVRDFSCDYDLLLVAAGKIARVFMLAAPWAR